MAKGKPPGKVVRLKAPTVLGEGKELGEALKAVGITKRKAGAGNRVRRTATKLPTAAELLRNTATPPLGLGRRDPGVAVPAPELEDGDRSPLPTAAELLELTSDQGGRDVTTSRDRREYLSPPNSLDPERPRAREVWYDPDTGTLHVVFRHGGTYEYFGVPHQTWRALKNNRSFGQTFDRLIKDTYQFEKVAF